MKYKYQTFEDYIEEIEGVCLRLERFHEEFEKVNPKLRERMLEWLNAAFECGREKEDE